MTHAAQVRLDKWRRTIVLLGGAQRGAPTLQQGSQFHGLNLTADGQQGLGYTTTPVHRGLPGWHHGYQGSLLGSSRSFCTPHQPGGLPSISTHGSPASHTCPACSSTSHQRAQALALSISQRHTQCSTYHAVAHHLTHHLSSTPPALTTEQTLLQKSQLHHTRHTTAHQPLRSHAAHMFTATLTPDVHAWAPPILQDPTMPDSQYQRLRQLLMPTPLRGWAASVTWSAPAVLGVTALGCTEILLLPGLPGGVSLGTMAAEGLWSAVGCSSSLEHLLAASAGLEAVQAFSLARKLGQLAVLDMVIRTVTGGKPSHIFKMTLQDPLNKQHGWYWWACVGLVGLGSVSAVHQGCSALLVSAWEQAARLLPGMTETLPSSASAPGWFAAGDQRTLPYRCRWWAETCVLAPVMEETFFRGFLLASLTKYMPVWGALLASSSVFALCHMGSSGVGDLPQLIGMACVLGFIFVRSRNLMAPIAAHSMHNACAMMGA